jgi:uncharacterized membrane protein HdeD (DUF308 family)
MDTTTISLAHTLSRHWWLVLLRGLVAIAFGVLALAQPGISTLALVLLIGAYMLADGVLGTWAAIASRKTYDDWWLLLLWGLTGIVAGGLTFFVPEITALVIMFYIAVWAIANGVLQIVAAVRLRKEIKGEWMLVLGGLASVAFGVIVLMQPAAGALVLLWLIASFALVFGVLLVALAFRLRKFGKEFAGSPPVRPRMTGTGTGTGTPVDPFTPASGHLGHL